MSLPKMIVDNTVSSGVIVENGKVFVVAGVSERRKLKYRNKGSVHRLLSESTQRLVGSEKEKDVKRGSKSPY